MPESIKLKWLLLIFVALVLPNQQPPMLNQYEEILKYVLKTVCL
jgi:hypothetical protein